MDYAGRRGNMGVSDVAGRADAIIARMAADLAARQAAAQQLEPSLAALVRGPDGRSLLRDLAFDPRALPIEDAERGVRLLADVHAGLPRFVESSRAVEGPMGELQELLRQERRAVGIGHGELWLSAASSVDRSETASAIGDLMVAPASVREGLLGQQRSHTRHLGGWTMNSLRTDVSRAAATGVRELQAEVAQHRAVSHYVTSDLVDGPPPAPAAGLPAPTWDSARSPAGRAIGRGLEPSLQRLMAKNAADDATGAAELGRAGAHAGMRTMSGMVARFAERAGAPGGAVDQLDAHAYDLVEALAARELAADRISRIPALLDQLPGGGPPPLQVLGDDLGGVAVPAVREAAAVLARAAADEASYLASERMVAARVAVLRERLLAETSAVRLAPGSLERIVSVVDRALAPAAPLATVPLRRDGHPPLRAALAKAGQNLDVGHSSPDPSWSVRLREIADAYAGIASTVRRAPDVDGAVDELRLLLDELGPADARWNGLAARLRSETTERAAEVAAAGSARGHGVVEAQAAAGDITAMRAGGLG